MEVGRQKDFKRDNNVFVCRNPTPFSYNFFSFANRMLLYFFLVVVVILESLDADVGLRLILWIDVFPFLFKNDQTIAEMCD